MVVKKYLEVTSLFWCLNETIHSVCSSHNKKLKVLLQYMELNRRSSTKIFSTPIPFPYGDSKFKIKRKTLHIYTKINFKKPSSKHLLYHVFKKITEPESAIFRPAHF